MSETNIEDEELNADIEELNRRLSQFESTDNLGKDGEFKTGLDDIVEEMKQIKQAIVGNTDMIERMDLTIDSCTYKLYDCTHNYTACMDSIKNYQTALLSSNISRTDLVLKLAEIDEQIMQMKARYDKRYTKLNQEKLEMQSKQEKVTQLLDEALKSLENCYNIFLTTLEDMKVNATASEINLLDSKYTILIDQYENDMLDYKNLQLTGWRCINSEVKIAGALESRGLKVTKSGHIMTDEGKSHTIKEAYESGLLDGIDIDWTKYFSKNVLPSELGGISTEASSISSKLSDEDVGYLKRTVGKPLTLALAEITAKQPKDPIHYLAHWLFKYRYNNEVKESDEREVKKLNAERDRIAKEKWQQFLENEAKEAVWDMIVNAENTAIANELRRIEMEAMAEEEEEENLDDEARDQLGVYGGPPTGQRSSFN